MIVTILLIVVGVYLVIGLLFAIPFVLKGVQKIDHGADGGSIGFRIIIIPGTMVFWPLLLRKWIKAIKHPSHD